MSKPSRESIRVAAYYDYRNGNTNASDVARRICHAFGEKTVSGMTIMRWFAILRDDDTMTLDAFLKAGSTTAASGGGGAKKDSPKAKATPKPKASRKTTKKKSAGAGAGEQTPVKPEPPTEDKYAQEQHAQMSTECPPTVIVEEKKPPPKKRASKKKAETPAQPKVEPDAVAVGQTDQSTAERLLADAPNPTTEQKKPPPKKRASKKKTETPAQPKVEPDAAGIGQGEQSTTERPLSDPTILATEQKKPPPKKRVNKKKADMPSVESGTAAKKPKLEVEAAVARTVESEANVSKSVKSENNDVEMTPVEETAAKEPAIESEKMPTELEANVATETSVIGTEVATMVPVELEVSAAAQASMTEAKMAPVEPETDAAAEASVIGKEMVEMAPVEPNTNAAEEELPIETEAVEKAPVEPGTNVDAKSPQAMSEEDADEFYDC